MPTPAARRQNEGDTPQKRPIDVRMADSGSISFVFDGPDVLFPACSSRRAPPASGEWLAGGPGRMRLLADEGQHLVANHLELRLVAGLHVEAQQRLSVGWPHVEPPEVLNGSVGAA